MKNHFTFVRFAASGPSGSVGPSARARVLVKVQPVGAHDFRALAFDAVVEYVAHLLVRVRKVSVTSRAQVVGLRVFCGGGGGGGTETENKTKIKNHVHTHTRGARTGVVAQNDGDDCRSNSTVSII